MLDSLTTRAMLQGPNRESFAVRQLRGANAIPVVAAYPSRRQLSNAVALFIECFQDAFDALEARARAEGFGGYSWAEFRETLLTDFTAFVQESVPARRAG